MNKTAIKIDLSAFFQDEQRLVYIMVNPSWENVESLQKRLECLFDIESVRLLNSDGCYLPPQESIEIIEFCKELKAFVPNESLAKREKKKKKKSKYLQKCPQETENEEKFPDIGKIHTNDDVTKKRKYYSLDSMHAASPESKNVKRRKSSKVIEENATSIQHDNKCMEITSTSEQYTVETGSCKKTKTKKTKNFESVDAAESGHQTDKNRELVMEGKTENAEEIISNNTKISLQSTKGHSSSILNESKLIAQKNSNISSLKKTNLNNPFKKNKSSKSHFYFNDSGEIVSTTETSETKSDKKSKIIVIFRCPLQEITSNKENLRARTFCDKRKICNKQNKKQLVEIKETILLEPIPNLVFETKNLLRKDNETNKILVKENAAEQTHEQKITQISESDVEVNVTEENPVLSDTTNIENSTKIVENIDIPSDNCLEKNQIDNTAECVDLSIESEEDVSKTTSILNENNSYSDIEEISEIIDLNETEGNFSSPFNNSIPYSCSSEHVKTEKILPFCTNMTQLPNINDIMVFKMAYADRKGQETNFIAGRVEYINKRTKSIKLLILDGLSEIRYIDTKFLCNCIDSEEILKYLQFKMSDVIEPKVFSGC